MSGPEDGRPREGLFETTHWSLVVAAGDASSAASADALARLCESYWYPLYVYLRRWGVDADEAQDLTQEFFARVLEKRYLRQADRDRGRFRSFLLASLKHFLLNERDRQRAQKRGGGLPSLSLEIENAEGRYQLEPADAETPERVFERRWALTLLDRVLGQLREEYRSGGKTALFDQLLPALTGGEPAAPYAETGARLGMSEGAVKVAVHRLRRRYGERLRQAIAETVGRPEEVDDEIRHLFAALEPSSR